MEKTRWIILIFLCRYNSVSRKDAIANCLLCTFLCKFWQRDRHIECLFILQCFSLFTFLCKFGTERDILSAYSFCNVFLLLQKGMRGHVSQRGLMRKMTKMLQWNNHQTNLIGLILIAHPGNHHSTLWKQALRVSSICHCSYFDNTLLKSFVWGLFRLKPRGYITWFCWVKYFF